MFSSSLVFQQHFRFPLEFLPVVLFGVRIDFFIVSLSMTFCSIFLLGFCSGFIWLYCNIFFDFFIKLLTTSCCWSIHNSINYFYIYSFFLNFYSARVFLIFFEGMSVSFGLFPCWFWMFISVFMVLCLHLRIFFRKDGWQVSIFFCLSRYILQGESLFWFLFPFSFF